MTPKDKAIELYEKMYYAIHINGEQDYKDSAEKCAIILANEVLKELLPNQKEEAVYWEEVKIEIRKI